MIPRTENELTISSVTQRDDEKSETLTAPNPRPLLLRMIGNISINQRGNGSRRLVHKMPPLDPTLSAQLLTADTVAPGLPPSVLPKCTVC